MGWPNVAAARHDFADTIASLTPDPQALTLADVVVHHQDVRRGLHIDALPTAEHVRMSLDCLTTYKRATLLLEPRGLLDGLRFEATDLGWAWGEGKSISGTGEAILMAMTRRDTLDELTGEGVATLHARIAAV